MLKLPKAVSGILSNDERTIFYLVLIINIGYLFYTRYYPSMDGPAHLYNATLIKHLILKNSFVAEFYQFNSFPVPNWTSHFILSFFSLFLPGWLSEKMMILLYITGMALSFRYLVKVMKPGNLSLSVFIFPFTYSFLFHIGFYNYCLSFIFFFLALGYWIKNYHIHYPRLYVVTGLLLLLTYFSNILTYAFLGIILGSIIFLFELKTNQVKGQFKTFWNRIMRLMLCSLPSLLLLFWFFHTVSFPRSIHQYAASELFKWINDVRTLIVYSYSKEEIITEQFLHILLFLYLLSFFYDVNKFNLKNRYSNILQVIVYFPFVLSIIFLFVLPDSSSAGMMSDRLILLIFILFMLMVVTQKLPRRIQQITALLIVSLHLILLSKHSLTIKELDRDATAISESAKHLEGNKIVLPVNLSDNWLQGHFSNYLGSDKPLVILDNYEANLGWFPLQWNPDGPKILLGDRNSVSGLAWYVSKSKETRQIDYIFLYGNLSKLQDNNWMELNKLLSSDYILEFESENKYIQLFKINLKPF